MTNIKHTKAIQSSEKEKTTTKQPKKYLKYLKTKEKPKKNPRKPSSSLCFEMQKDIPQRFPPYCNRTSEIHWLQVEILKPPSLATFPQSSQ